MESTSPKKTKILKKILTWTGISFLLLLIAIILVPIFFKDKLKELVLDEVNKMLLAEIQLDDFDLTLLSTFPNLSIQLSGTRVIGLNEFEGVKLADVKTIRADVGLWDVIKGETISINAVYLDEPKIDVRVLQDGLANYDIMKPDSLKTPEEVEEPSNFKLELKEYGISSGNIRYDDRAGNLFAEILNLNHTGTGDLTADVIDFKTKTTTDELSFKMDGLTYLSGVKTDIVANLLMEFSEASSKFTLKENTFQLNALKFGIDGYYEMLEKHDEMDLKLVADKATFKEFISLIPKFYHTGYESMLASGSLELKAQVKGKLDETNLPGWDAGIKVANASIKYPDLPGKIGNITLIAGSKFAGGTNMDKMTVDIDKFKAEFAGNTIDATAKIRSVMSDPAIVATLLAKVDLATLGKVIPLAEGEMYNGKLDADVSVDGRMSYIDNENYEAFKALGTLSLKDFEYASPDLNQAVEVKEMLFRFAPQYLSLEKLDAKAGKSDFVMEGKIDNYMGYIFRDELLKGNFTFNSNHLDLDELMNIMPASEEATEEQTAASTADSEPFEIPGNIDFALNTTIKEAKFNGMAVEDVKGLVTLKDKVATLHNLNLRGLGGNIGLNGSYNTVNPDRPKASFGYKLIDLSIEELVSNFVTIEKLAPILKHLKGKVTSNFSLSTDLTSNFDPILATVNGLGDFGSSSVLVTDVKIFDKISEVTHLNNFNNQTIKNLKAAFKVDNGQVALKPFDVVLGGIKTNIHGVANLDQTIDYKMKMLIPKDKLPKKIIQSIEEAAAKANSLAPKLNLASIPNQIAVDANVIGTFLDPKITTNFKEKLMELSGNMKDALIQSVTDQANAVVDKAKDSVKVIVNDAIDKGKAELEKKKQELLANAQKQADKVKEEGKKATERAKLEADKAYDKAIAAAGDNPIQKKIAEAAAKKAKEEAYKKANQLETEANKQADGIMSKAREEADKLQ